MNNRSGIILTMGILLSGLCFSCSKQLNEGDSPATFDIPDFSTKPERFREEFETRVSELLHNPDSAQARSQLALFFHANAQYTQASDLYLQLIEEDHSDGRWPYYLARILQDRGQSQEAIRWLKASVERNGDFALSYLRLGDIYLKTDQVEKANVAYKQCLERAVDNPHALLGLARLEIQRKNWSGARDHLLKSIASNPDILTAYSLLTIVYQELGENELAAEARRIGETKYRYFEPEDPWLEELYDHCFDPYQLSVAADMYLNTHRESKALALLQLAIDRDPERARTYLEAAKAHLKVQDTKQGIDFLKQAIRLDPQIEDAHYQLVSELESSGNLKTALAASQAAIRVNLHSAGLYRQQGVLLEASGQATQAVAAYRKAVELDPGDEKNSEALANFYWTLGETKQA
ncbi:MAG: tetratricopeptide repeat protein, partial [Verrucomicrobiae bacterium]|nr:tetratricopeptide repeat protein [Verrucomicrobiae bacterium]